MLGSNTGTIRINLNKRYMKEKIPEVYVIEYPTNGKSYHDATNEMFVLQKKLDDVRSEITPEGYRKMSGVRNDHRTFIVVGAKTDEIVMKLVYPHEAVMPSSFLPDILSQSLFREDLDETKIYDFTLIVEKLVFQGWNPSIAFSGRINCMYFDVRPGYLSVSSLGTSWLVYFNDDMLSDYNKYKEKYDHVKYDTTPYVVYIEWKQKYLKEHPEMSFEHWRNIIKLEVEA